MSPLLSIVFFTVVVLTGAVVGVFRYKRAKKGIINSNVIKLKERGVQISVDLPVCEIKSNQYYEDDILKHISILVYTAKLSDDIDYSFKSVPIYLSKERLYERLIEQKQTVIYYTPENPGDYYFDVAFLMEYLL
jgi:hypothetical protein